MCYIKMDFIIKARDCVELWSEIVIIQMKKAPKRLLV